MPAPKIITKELIINQAFSLVREKGKEELSARNIAKKIGCSTQPIYSCFSNMQELTTAIVKHAMQYAIDKFLLPKEEDDEFMQMGLGYIKLAREEKNLFKLLFLTENYFSENGLDIWRENEELLLTNMKNDNHLKGLSDDILLQILKDMRIYSHGLATIVYTSPNIITDQEVFNLISQMGKKNIEWELSNQANQVIHLK